MDTLMRIYLNVEPDNLDDETWSARWRELQWALSEGHPRTF